MERALTWDDYTPAQKKRHRRYEFVPASLVWSTLVGAIVLSFVNPIWAVFFIIAFDLYWFFRVLYFVIFLTISWRRHRGALDIDWEAELQKTPGWEKIRHLVFLPTYKEDSEILRATFQSLVSAKVDPKRMIVVLAGEERAGREAFLERANTNDS